jgi:hypothetical protein
MQVPGRRSLGGRSHEVKVVPLDPVPAGMRRIEAERPEDGAVEALRRGEIGDPDRYVVEHVPTVAAARRSPWLLTPAGQRERMGAPTRR